MGISANVRSFARDVRAGERKAHRLSAESPSLPRGSAEVPNAWRSHVCGDRFLELDLRAQTLHIAAYDSHCHFLAPQRYETCSFAPQRPAAVFYSFRDWQLRRSCDAGEATTHAFRGPSKAECVSVPVPHPAQTGITSGFRESVSAPASRCAPYRTDSTPPRRFSSNREGNEQGHRGDRHHEGGAPAEHVE